MILDTGPIAKQQKKKTPTFCSNFSLKKMSTIGNKPRMW